MEVTVHFEDRDWTFNPARPSYKQSLAIQLETGLSINEWENVLDVDEETDEQGNVTGFKDPGPIWMKCVGCLYWLMHNANGHKFPLADMDFDVYGFLEAFADGMLAALQAAKTAAAAEEAEPDPTPPGSSSPATSTTSATPTATTPPPPDRQEVVTSTG